MRSAGLSLGLSLALGAAMLGLGWLRPAQAQVQPVISGPPDVVIVVYQQPGGADAVDITYAHTVPRAQAVQDSKALAQTAGWQASTSHIKDAAAPMETKFGAMTSIAFQEPGVIQDSTHTFPVETFARAFHTYKRLNIVFFVGPQFQFQGQRSYADNDIKVALDQQGTTFAYQIEITNSNFGRLPLAQTPANTQDSIGDTSPWRISLAILGLAALIGLVVYFLTVRFMPPAGPKSEAKNTDDAKNIDNAAETRLEVGTKR